MADGSGGIRMGTFDRLGPVAALASALACGPAVAAAPTCDFFCYMTAANKASLVMLDERGLLPPALARQIAAGIDQVAAEQDARGAKRWTNYLDFEKRLLEVAGPEASRLHTGRSRQDLHETVRRMLMRDAHLATLGELLDAQAALLELAGRHVETVIPAYTHGVQAQPTTLAHYLLAYSEALGRDADRLRELYPRLNRSPLGAAALGTSGFAIDRERLAALLGFAGPVENSYDANLLSSADVKIEFANVLANSAIHVGQFAQDLHAQYREARPWMLLDAGTTDVSSIMPQKRNPRPVDRLRSAATEVVAGAQAVTLAAHNTNTGMNDYRGTEPLFAVTDAAGDMYASWAKLLGGLRVDPAAALAVIAGDYSTMTEVADTLLREADVPFRVAHHYASELTDYGRTQGKRPDQLTDAEITRVYQQANGTELPVAPGVIRDAMDPVKMVESRRGLGGPQPAEVRRMLAGAATGLEAQRAWLGAERRRLAGAAAGLEKSFDAAAQ
jgi:argininosuccinate lyase